VFDRLDVGFIVIQLFHYLGRGWSISVGKFCRHFSAFVLNCDVWYVFGDDKNSWAYALTFKSLPVTWCTTSLTFNNCTVCPHCIYVFCIYLRTNSDFCHLQHKLIGFYNRDEKCLLRGTGGVFKYSSLPFFLKGSITSSRLIFQTFSHWCNSQILNCNISWHIGSNSYTSLDKCDECLFQQGEAND